MMGLWNTELPTTTPDWPAIDEMREEEHLRQTMEAVTSILAQKQLETLAKNKKKSVKPKS